jgi:hypothetical protein
MTSANVLADIPEWGWLQAAGQAAGVVLIVELMLLLLITTALVVALALLLHYIHNKVIPLLTRFAPAIEQRLQATDRGSTRFAERVIDIHARAVAIREGVKTFVRPNGHNGHQELPPGRDGATARLEGYTPGDQRALPGRTNGN